MGCYRRIANPVGPEPGMVGPETYAIGKALFKKYSKLVMKMQINSDVNSFGSEYLF